MESATYQYAEAYQSYKDALIHKADDTTITNALERVRKQHMKDVKGMFQIVAMKWG